MFDLNWLGWLAVSISAFVIGVAKTGIPGSGILAIPLAAFALPARVSVGFLLPLLMFADIFSVAYYRHDVQWRNLLRLIPWTLLGIFLGYLALDRVTDQQLRQTIAVIVVFMLGVRWLRERSREENPPIPTYWWFAALLGLLAGGASMVANAAGPIMTIYLLAMRMPKIEFIGTNAWYFFMVNWIKAPFSLTLGLISADSLKLNLVLLPLIAFGAVAGIFAAKRIPQSLFALIVQILAAAAALRLLFSFP